MGRQARWVHLRQVGLKMGLRQEMARDDVRQEMARDEVRQEETRDDLRQAVQKRWAPRAATEGAELVTDQQPQLPIEQACSGAGQLDRTMR